MSEATHSYIPDPGEVYDLIAALSAANQRLRSLLPPHAPITPGTLAVPEDLLWRVSRHLRVLTMIVLSGEVHAEAEADRAEVFRLLTEAPAP